MTVGSFLSNPFVITIGGIVVTLAVAAGYSMYTGRRTSVDVDDDGEPEIEFGPSGPCEDGGEEKADESQNVEVEASNTNYDDPTPDRVKEIGGDLTKITGIGPSRANTLKSQGYDVAADLYYAADENITAVRGFGPKAVSDIRSDIGSIEGNGSSDDSTGDE